MFIAADILSTTVENHNCQVEVDVFSLVRSMMTCRPDIIQTQVRTAHTSAIAPVDVIDIREKYFNVTSLKVLFKEVPSDIIFNFLKEINIFYKL